ncbi:uncharacterized protein VTP21DRAFT_154 [Calcarisporiella thermophila]|uniref:uncharacterized protein n=1 Tax=Calcarisporiella thermophila TaxID=911321 RepID=UPI00374435F6
MVTDVLDAQALSNISSAMTSTSGNVLSSSSSSWLRDKEIQQRARVRQLERLEMELEEIASRLEVSSSDGNTTDLELNSDDLEYIGEELGQLPELELALQSHRNRKDMVGKHAEIGGREPNLTPSSDSPTRYSSYRSPSMRKIHGSPHFGQSRHFRVRSKSRSPFKTVLISPAASPGRTRSSSYSRDSRALDSDVSSSSSPSYDPYREARAIAGLPRAISSRSRRRSEMMWARSPINIRDSPKYRYQPGSYSPYRGSRRRILPHDYMDRMNSLRGNYASPIRSENDLMQDLISMTSPRRYSPSSSEELDDASSSNNSEFEADDVGYRRQNDSYSTRSSSRSRSWSSSRRRRAPSHHFSSSTSSSVLLPDIPLPPPRGHVGSSFVGDEWELDYSPQNFFPRDRLPPPIEPSRTSLSELLAQRRKSIDSMSVSLSNAPAPSQKQREFSTEGSVRTNHRNTLPFNPMDAGNTSYNLSSPRLQEQRVNLVPSNVINATQQPFQFPTQASAPPNVTVPIQQPNTTAFPSTNNPFREKGAEAMRLRQEPPQATANAPSYSFVPLEKETSSIAHEVQPPDSIPHQPVLPVATTAPQYTPVTGAQAYRDNAASVPNKSVSTSAPVPTNSLVTNKEQDASKLPATIGSQSEIDPKLLAKQAPVSENSSLPNNRLLPTKTDTTDSFIKNRKRGQSMSSTLAQKQPIPELMPPMHMRPLQFTSSLTKISSPAPQNQQADSTKSVASSTLASAVGEITTKLVQSSSAENPPFKRFSTSTVASATTKETLSSVPAPAHQVHLKHSSGDSTENPKQDPSQSNSLVKLKDSNHSDSANRLPITPHQSISKSSDPLESTPKAQQRASQPVLSKSFTDSKLRYTMITTSSSLSSSATKTEKLIQPDVPDLTSSQPSTSSAVKSLNPPAISGGSMPSGSDKTAIKWESKLTTTPSTSKVSVHTSPPYLPASPRIMPLADEDVPIRQSDFLNSNSSRQSNPLLIATRLRDKERAMRDKKSIATAMTPQQAIRTHSAQLTLYERNEILEYPKVYYLGQHASGQKKAANLEVSHNNFGYDDDRGDYQIVIRDHISYRYEVLDILGKGSFGQVARCYDHRTGELAAVKIIRNKKRFHKQAQVEVRILGSIVKWDPDNKHNCVRMIGNFHFRGHLCIAFECLSINLYEFIKNNHFQGFSLGLIRKFTTQILASLVLLHKHKVIHCDLKPENVLLKDPTRSGIKVIDFGSSCFENERIYTYIQSRFYRSPEVILQLPYDMAIDMWSLGCILAELHTGYPLFPGENEQDQLACIMEVIGVPDRAFIDRSIRKHLFFDGDQPLAVVTQKGKRRRPGSRTLQGVLRCNDMAFVDFVTRCLCWDPEKRLKPAEAMQHPWITETRMSSNGAGSSNGPTGSGKNALQNAFEAVRRRNAPLPLIPSKQTTTKGSNKEILEDTTRTTTHRVSTGVKLPLNPAPPHPPPPKPISILNHLSKTNHPSPASMAASAVIAEGQERTRRLSLLASTSSAGGRENGQVEIAAFVKMQK